MADPSGADTSTEYVELVATGTIDFSVNHYSVVFLNNGSATADGWIAGGSLTYGFSITSGTVAAGDVVYVGGSSMAPTGTKLRVLSTSLDGDSFGSGNGSGVLGNGGGNADGIAEGRDMAFPSLRHGEGWEQRDEEQGGVNVFHAQVVGLKK